MLKRLLIFITLVSLLLTACKQALGQPVSTATAKPSVNAYASVTPTKTSPIQAAQPQQTAPAGPTAPPGCTVVSAQPTPGPTEQSAFPPISDKDWVLGPENAYVTIMEYGDFQ